MMNMKQILCTVWVIACPLLVQAMDFREVYEAAEQNDARIRAARAAASAAREKLPQAQAQRLPNVSFNAGVNRNHLTTSTTMNARPISYTYSYDSSNQVLQLRQPLYRPYVGALVDQARAQVEDANAVLESNEQDLLVRVAEAYFDALLAREQLDLIAAQKTAYAAQLESAKKGFEAGVGVRTDIDDAQARVDMTRALELEAAQNYEFTRHRLSVLVGRPVEALASLNAKGLRPGQPLPASMDAWIAMAEQNSPQLASLRAQLDSALMEIEKAKAGHKPTLDAVAGWSRSDSDSVTSVNTAYNQKFVGLQLSVPLYSGGYVNSTVRQAVAESERAREALEAAQLELGSRVYEQYRAMTEGALRISALEQAVRSAEQVVKSSRMSFKGGVRSIVDVLNAEQQHVTALRDLAQARYAYLLAQVRLQSLAGKDRWATVDQANAYLTP
ncbi:TolC family outer membrane protein [Comamonas aquatica]|jgi:outer membrane protein/protease secretion system outer membrane protein|uniref:Outer membrane protein tolC n=2 Tax=Pseudomonadota TaxID=1224 RepID=A0AA35D9A7_9BURK|nr:TolC family outer membrane protein [Comamonas aquatica]CAB5685336.1 Outer membrane protein tolC precursor [Comamonas aquatica]CAB5701355.1 Outer membrane protein tolC precursor [Comamonas aquatica]CAC9196897.1 Outer membrane protein tolC precursor [Comamonas aquatica]CAC9689732.1 Outer membrane protein tolC precursor [Comamonas aquatica]